MRLCIALLLGLITIFTFPAWGQAGLEVVYDGASGVPDFLNICGDADEVAVLIRTNGLQTGTRTNLTARLQLFKGLQWQQLSIEKSSPGVTVQSVRSPGEVWLQLPDLRPGGSDVVRIVYAVSAGCELLDTLQQNNDAEVRDDWTLQFQLNGTAQETVRSPGSYRDALAIPSFSLFVDRSATPMRSGDCINRYVTLTNSALDGFVDTLRYSVVQSPGAWIKSVRVAGNTVPFRKSVTAGRDTVLEILLTGEHFATNTKDGLPGDGDGDFDPDEQLTLEEEVCLLDCTRGLSSAHTIAWGCGGTTCASASVEDVLPLADGAPNGIWQPNPAQVPAGYCNNGTVTATFSNAGFETVTNFGAMRDLELEIGLGDQFAIEDQGLLITGYRLGRVEWTGSNGILILDGAEQLRSDPDGPGGLADIDGDGFFDDLPVGASIQLTAMYSYRCAPQTAGDCGANLDAAFHAKAGYADACNQRTTRTIKNIIQPRNRNLGAEILSRPVDITAEKDTFFAQLSLFREIRDFAGTCREGSQVTVTLLLPEGMEPVMSHTFLLKGGNRSLNISGNSKEGNQLILTFDAPTDFSAGGDYFLQVALMAGCNARAGQSDIGLSVNYTCCNCNQRWYCGNLPGPFIHLVNPPCSETPECVNGLQATGFTVVRSTLGFTTPDYDNKIDAASANRQVALTGDTLDMQMSAVAGPITAAYDSAGWLINYSNIAGSTSAQPLFLLGSGELRLSRNGQIQICAISADQVYFSGSGADKSLRIDMMPCLDALGWQLQAGDQLSFAGKFVVNPDGPVTAEYRRVPNLRASAFLFANGQRNTCESFGADLTLVNPLTVVSIPEEKDFPKGCEESTLDFDLVIVDPGHAQYFGNEYRPAIRLDSLRLILDTALQGAFNPLEVSIFLPGHPLYGDGYTPVPVFQDGGLWRFTDFVVAPTLNDPGAAALSVRLKLRPVCGATGGGSGPNGAFVVRPVFYYQDHYYAEGGKAATLAAPALIQYTEAPQLRLAPVGTTNVVLRGDTAVWNLQLCNIASGAATGRTWISLTGLPSGLNITSLEILDSLGVGSGLPLQSYSNGYFAWTDALPAGACQKLRVKAVLDSCRVLSYQVSSGWVCAVDVGEEWTPANSGVCQDQQLELLVSPQIPVLDANITAQPQEPFSLCDTATFEILIRNTGQGAALDMTTVLQMPAGMQLVPGSVSIAFPASTNYQPAIADPVQQGNQWVYNGFQNMSSALAANGLSGFNPTRPVRENEFKIRFRAIADCSFNSGDVIRYSFRGVKSCGDPSNLEAGETVPLVVLGAENDRNKLFGVNLSGTPAPNVNRAFVVRLDVVNLSSGPSDSLDHIKIILPPGLDYQPGSASQIQPADWQPGDPELQIENDQQVLIWPLVNGLARGDTASIKFTLLASGLGCGADSVAVRLQSVSIRNLECPDRDLACPIQTLTSSADAVWRIALPEGDPPVLTWVDAAAVCADQGREQITLSGRIANAPVGQGFRIYYISDDNGNKQPDAGEDTLSVQLIVPTPLGAVSFTHALSVDADQVCKLLFYANEAPLCSPIAENTPLPRLVNAGADAVFCGDQTFSVAVGNPDCQSAAYTYRWTTVPATFVNNLSDATAAAPTLTLPADVSEDQILLSLETTRPGCSESTEDIVVLRRAPGVQLVPPPVITVVAGNTVKLEPEVFSGQAPYRFEWAPGPGITDFTLPEQSLQPTEDASYSVTVTDANGCSAAVVFEIRILQQTFSLSATPVDTTICAGTDVLLSASGATQYLWRPIPGNPAGGTLDNPESPEVVFSGGLPGRQYVFEVVATHDAFPGQRDSVQVVIRVAPALEISLTSGLSGCAGDTLALRATVDGGSGGLTYNWSPAVLSGQGTANIEVILGSQTTTWTLQVTDATGCTASTTSTVRLNENCNNCAFFAGIDTLYGQAACDGLAAVCLPLEQSPDQYTLTLNGAPFDPQLTRCGFDTLIFYSFANLFGQGNSGPYFLNDWLVNEENFSGAFSNINALLDSMRRWNPEGRWQISNQGAFIAGLKNGNSFGALRIQVLSLGITTSLPVSEGVSPSGYAVQLPVGNYTLGLTDPVSGCSDAVAIKVVCTTTDTLRIILDEGTRDTVCLPLNEISGPVRRITAACNTAPEVADFSRLSANCVEITAGQMGETAICLVMCDARGICDTTIVKVTVMDLVDNVLRDTIVAGQVKSYCIDTSKLLLDGHFTAISNLCPNESSGLVQFSPDPETFCITYEGLAEGTATACLEICNENGECVPVTFEVTVLPGVIVTDTVLVFFDTVEYCLDRSMAPGFKLDMRDLCAGQNGEHVNFSLDTNRYCVTYTGVAPGMDTACILLTNEIGQSWLTVFYIKAVRPLPDTLVDTVYINQTEVHCLDTSELRAALIRIDNACPEASGTAIDFYLDPLTFCVEYTGLEIGREQACIVFCDANGLCDTTILEIIVAEYDEPPIAVNDTTATNKGVPAVLDITANDLDFGVTRRFILQAPLYGDAVLNLDNSITYVPNEAYCDRSDQMTYVICNNVGCDTATVIFNIQCVEVTFFTAVSPNGDGVNDVFYIGGIDDLPENSLLIYNRWGALVFARENYRNDWSGTTDSGTKDLPDGTYFYIFTVKKGEEEQVYRGYFELFR